jgi:CubicO group peptidase (beta-lactamase class C family)
MPGFQFINSGGAPGASVGVGISTIVGPTGPAGGVSFNTPINASFTALANGGIQARVGGALGFVATKGEAFAAGNINLPDTQDKFTTFGAANTGGDFAGAYNYTGTYVQWGSIGKVLIGMAFGKMMEDRFVANAATAEMFTSTTTVASLIPNLTQGSSTAVVLQNVTANTSSGANQWTIASSGTFNLSTLTMQNLLQYNFGSFAIPIGFGAAVDTFHPVFGYALGDSLGGVTNMVNQGRSADVYIDNMDLYASTYDRATLNAGLTSGFLPQNPSTLNAGAIQQALGWATWTDNLTGAGYYNDAISSTGGGVYADNLRVINNAKAASGAYVPLSFSSRGTTDFFTTGANRNPFGVTQTFGRYNFYTFNLLAQALDNLARKNGTTLISYIRTKILTPLGMTKTYFSFGEAGPADLQANKAQLTWSRTNLEIYMQTGVFDSSGTVAVNPAAYGNFPIGYTPLNYGCSTGYNAAWTNAYTLALTQLGGGIALKLMAGPLVFSSQYPDDGQSRLYDLTTSTDAVFPGQVFGEAPVYSTLADMAKLFKCIMKYGKVNGTQALSPYLIEWTLHPKTSSLINLTTFGGSSDDGNRNTWCGGLLKRNVETDTDCAYFTSDSSFTVGSAFGSTVFFNMKTGYWAIWHNNVSFNSSQSLLMNSLPSLYNPIVSTFPQLVDLN